MEKGLRMPLFARLARDSAPPMLIALDISGASTGIFSLLSQVVAQPVRKVKVQLVSKKWYLPEWVTDGKPGRLLTTV